MPGLQRGKILTVEMESNAGPQYSHPQCYNSLFSIPNRNASGINEHLMKIIVK
jgi:hypothetical protein